MAHYAAVLLGCTVVLWFGGAVRGRTALLTLLGAGAALVGAHTRTAPIAMTVGLVVAGASMFMGHARVRRTSALLVVLALTTATLFAPLILDWLWRGQTCRRPHSSPGGPSVVGHLRAGTPVAGELFGSGLSNKSFNGL